MAIPRITLSPNPHWYSKFWLRQFYQLWRQGEIKLRPELKTFNPPACVYFALNGQACLIDVSDHKTLAHDPSQYAVYFKANYDPARRYPANVLPSINGTTLTRHNVPPTAPYQYDIVWITGISGGRPHKIALFEALASLPLKSKLAARMVSADDWQRWAPRLRAARVEVWKDNVPYRQWLELSKQGRWCVLVRGKHDCLSFKMIDYMSIGAAVIADYPPTSVWPIPVQANQHYLDMGCSGPQSNDLSDTAYEQLVHEYHDKLRALLPRLTGESERQRIAANNRAYFQQHIQNGQAARDILTAATTVMNASLRQPASQYE